LHVLATERASGPFFVVANASICFVLQPDTPSAFLVAKQLLQESCIRAAGKLHPAALFWWLCVY